MPAYLSAADSALLSPFGGEDPAPGWEQADTLPAGAGQVPAGVIATRLGGLERPGREGFAGAVVAGGGGAPVASGELLLFCHPVAVAPAVVRRGGEVQAGGWLPDHLRLGLLEGYLGDGVVEAVAARAAARGEQAEAARGGRPKKRRRRLGSLAMTARLTLAMTLMPDAGYHEVMTRLAGHLADLPWARPWHAPTTKVYTGWRRRLGPQAAEELFWAAAGPVADKPDWCGRHLGALDGFTARLPATDANRAAFPTPGTDGDDAAFPLLRAMIATARAGRAVLGAAQGSCHDGEQTLLRRLLTDHPAVFGEDMVYVMDRNWPGHDLIADVKTAGADLILRVKAGITLTGVRWLPDGSRLAYLTAPDKNSVLLLRVVEYTATLPGRATPELVCLATTLLDHERYPAAAVRQAYPQRWVASETTIGEDKSTITDAGPSRGPILRSGEPDLARQEFFAWLCATQLLRRAAAGTAAAAPRPVGTDQVSFTATRHAANRSMTQTRASATSSPAALAALTAATAVAALATLVTTGRDRHAPRERKYLPRFPRRSRTKPTTRGPATITCHHPGAEPDPPDTS